MLFRTALLSMLISGCASSAYAGDPWDKTDVALGAVALTATVIDWGQTRYIAKHPETFRETNDTIGRHPSVGRVNTHFIVYITSTAAAAHFMPSQYRKWFLSGFTIYELDLISHNKRLGIKMEF